MTFFNPSSRVLAGKDLHRGGTWLGAKVGREGRGALERFAVVHNYRHADPGSLISDGLSRGDLPLDFLNSSLTAEEYAREVARKGAAYNGFTLILLDEHGGAFACTNRPTTRYFPISPGFHSLSNAGIDADWPKQLHGLEVFKSVLRTAKRADAKELCRVLMSRVLRSDRVFRERLPGILKKETEIALSSVFVRPYQWEADGLYGTRAHSVVIWRRKRGSVVASADLRLPSLSLQREASEELAKDEEEGKGKWIVSQFELDAGTSARL